MKIALGVGQLPSFLDPLLGRNYNHKRKYRRLTVLSETVSRCLRHRLDLHKNLKRFIYLFAFAALSFWLHQDRHPKSLVQLRICPPKPIKREKKKKQKQKQTKKKSIERDLNSGRRTHRYSSMGARSHMEGPKRWRRFQRFLGYRFLRSCGRRRVSWVTAVSFKL